MRTALLVALLVTVPATAAETLRLSVGESQTIRMMGASAAWPIDASIVDVSAAGGNVTIFGRAAGKTKIMVVSITGENALDVVVEARLRIVAPAQQTQGSRGVAEARYSTAARELQNSVTVTRETKNRSEELNVRAVHYGGTPQGARAGTSIATASYRLFTRNRELTIFDRDVDHSPLTLNRTPLRGIHYRDDNWRLHAGYTAFTTYQSFFIPVERQFVAGGGYAFRTGARSTLTPSVFAYRGEGTVLSLLYDYRNGDRLLVKTELGYSNGLGAAAEVAYASDRDRIHADVRYRGDAFAVAGAGVPRGFFSDASWSHDYGRGSNAALTFSATDVAGTRVLAGSADVDHRLTEMVALTGGASWASFDGARNVTIPAGFRLDFGRSGIAALYRFARSETNRGGHGFRVTGRTSIGRLYMSAFADRQQNAPTLDLVFAERPDLALALGELGIVATTPADIARALRENAALIELGFIEGVTVELAPVRTQVGLELSLLGTTASRQQLRARLLHNVTETVANRTDTTIATLSYARRLTAATDLFASYSYWRTERRGEKALVQPVAEIGVRRRFDGFAIGGSGTISGTVFSDEDLDGSGDGTGVDAVVELDGNRTERTTADGSFAFRNVPRGTHRLVARVPSRPEAYFTTPSQVEASVGDNIVFGVAMTAARVNGRVTSDANTGIAGVRLLLARGPQQNTFSTTTDGTFSFAVAPGEWQLSILTESVPAGYSMTGSEPRSLILSRARPMEVAMSLRAHRSIAGKAEPNAVIEIRPLGTTVRADDQGRFLIRSLPAGDITLISGGVERRVVVPAEPATLTVNFDRPAAVARGDWFVLLGAYRVDANATETVERALASGVPASLSRKGLLTIVRAGPYGTRAEATHIASLLTRSGLEAVVASGN